MLFWSMPRPSAGSCLLRSLRCRPGLRSTRHWELALARLIWTRGAVRVLALAVALTLSEWLRGHLFSGFPWNTFGYALISPLWLAQSASLIGIWGLTFLAVAIYASPAVLADAGTDTQAALAGAGLGMAVIAGLAIFGAVRLATTPTEFVGGVRLRIMQPNLQQDREIQLRRQTGGHEPLSRPLGPC